MIGLLRYLLHFELLALLPLDVPNKPDNGKNIIKMHKIVSGNGIRMTTTGRVTQHLLQYPHYPE